MKKHNNKFICIVFLFMIFAVLAYYPVKYVLISKGIISLDYNNFKEAEIKEGNSLITRLDNQITRVKTSLENRVTNYFPLYSNINYTYSKINYKLNSLMYNDFVFLGMNADNEYAFRNDEIFILESNVNNLMLDSMFDKQMKFYEELSKEADVYMYLPNRYEFTILDDDSITVRDKDKYITKLKSLQNDSFKIKELKISSIDDYKKYFYKTDHHWNAYGAYQGYKDIMEMMKLTPKKLDIIETDITYMGSIAKSSAQTDIKDKFMYIDYNEKYDVKVNGLDNSKYKPKVINKTDNIYYDYYVSYYNGMFGEVVMDYNNPDKENLLIISDSYAWQIDEIIASHFNKTYIINVRYDKFINGSLDYKNFIKENNITKVLMLEESATSIFDMYNYGTSRKVLGN